MKKRPKLKSLSVRLPLLFVSSCTIILLVVLMVVFWRFNSRMVDEYTRMGEGVTSLMVQELNPDRIDEYIEKNYELEEYKEIEERFYSFKNNYPDVLFLYVYRITRDGAIVVFDLDDDDGGAGQNPGDIYELDEAFREDIDKLSVGAVVDPTIGDTPDGKLFTYVRPIFDSNDNYTCYACVDFSMDNVYGEDIRFISGLAALLAVAVAIILAIDIYVIKKDITGPINAIAKSTGEFAFETEADRFHNIQVLEELNIHSDDEIQDLYQVYISTQKESLYYMSKLSRALAEISDNEKRIDYISKTAYRDELTSVGNKNSYAEASKKLQKEIEEGIAEFALVMIDINNLKSVNDNYGHKAGDSYIKGCSAIICDVYKHSPVYRIGGDEFVVILRGEDYKARNSKMAQAITAFFDAYNNPGREPFEQYSASIGMSEYRFEDETVENVFKRADEAMYEYKIKFKSKYGSYR